MSFGVFRIHLLSESVAVCLPVHFIRSIRWNGDQKNYAIYDFGVVSEIVYRLEVKDKVQRFEQSQRTLCESRSIAKEALESMDLGVVYINMALQQYEVLYGAFYSVRLSLSVDVIRFTVYFVFGFEAGE